MSSWYECGIVEDDQFAVSSFLLLCHNDVESFFAEQREFKKEIELSHMLKQLDDTFSTEDRWPI